MTSKMPAAHYTNLVTAISSLTDAQQKARAAIKLLADTNHERRQAQHRKMLEDQALDAGARRHAAPL